MLISLTNILKQSIVIPALDAGIFVIKTSGSSPKVTKKIIPGIIQLCTVIDGRKLGVIVGLAPTILFSFFFPFLQIFIILQV